MNRNHRHSPGDWARMRARTAEFQAIEARRLAADHNIATRPVVADEVCSKSHCDEVAAVALWDRPFCARCAVSQCSEFVWHNARPGQD